MSGHLSQERLLAIIDTQNEIVANTLGMDAVLTLVARRAQAVTGAAGAVIERVAREDLVCETGSGSGEALVGVMAPLWRSLSGLCLREGGSVACDDAENDARVDREPAMSVGAVSILCVPVPVEGRFVAVLKVFSPQPRAFAEEDSRTLALLARLLASHVAHAQAVEHSLQESRHDFLTGLPNHRAFEERLGSEVARVRRHGGRLALCLLDLDGFRVINDTLGHGVGDEVLRAVATHLAQVRGEDIAFRLGADEFAIIFAETDDEGAAIAVRRLETAVIRDHGCGGVGVSWGVATLQGGDPAALLADAGAELYRVKRSRQR